MGNFLQQSQHVLHTAVVGWFEFDELVGSTSKSSIKGKILIWSTWFFQQMVTLNAPFWQGLKTFFFTFLKHFLQLYETKIHIFFVPSTWIKVKILIWSTWYFQQMVNSYEPFWQGLLQSSKVFTFTFIKHFLQLYMTKIQLLNIP